ncbi:MAG TPA: tetratricopeptide repeat protein [Rhizomicrobium sp.]|nr:tetratricopeptide repeat protein [Rhizomicrobium sp.]
MKLWTFAIAAALCAVLGTHPAMAGANDEWAACNGSVADGFSLDQQVAGCTARIQSGQESTHDTAVAYYNRGYTYQDMKKLDLALADYTQAIALRPDYADAYGNRSVVYTDTEQYQNAIDDCNRAMAARPDHPSDYYNRGRTYKLMGDYRHAIADEDTAIRLNPQYSDSYRVRGGAKRKLGDTAGADADYATADSIDKAKDSK